MPDAVLALVKKRWRAWLRAVHRDVGYLAIGFTVIYAVSGIAQNHIEDWGDVSYRSTERTIVIPAIAAEVPDAVAIQRVADAAGLGAPTSALRAGDEVRLDYANGAKVTAIATNVTIQTRERRAFVGLANWLHKARGKKAWKYLADAYAVFLLYLAMSGIFMIKGRLGLRWRGTILIGTGFAVPIAYVLLAGGPGAQQTREPDEPVRVAAPARVPAATPVPAPAAAPGTAMGAPGLPEGARPLPPDDD